MPDGAGRRAGYPASGRPPPLPPVRSQPTVLPWPRGSRSRAEINYLRTGCRTDGLLDVYYVTDDDVASGSNPFAAKIGAVTDAARALALGTEARHPS